MQCDAAPRKPAAKLRQTKEREAIACCPLRRNGSLLTGQTTEMPLERKTGIRRFCGKTGRLFFDFTGKDAFAGAKAMGFWLI